VGDDVVQLAGDLETFLDEAPAGLVGGGLLDRA